MLYNIDVQLQFRSIDYCDAVQQGCAMMPSYSSGVYITMMYGDVQLQLRSINYCDALQH